MKDIKDLLAVFLNLIQTAPSGKQVLFSIDYTQDEILITSAPSGFLRVLYRDDKLCAHLRPEGLKVQLFK